MPVEVYRKGIWAFEAEGKLTVRKSKKWVLLPPSICGLIRSNLSPGEKACLWPGPFIRNQVPIPVTALGNFAKKKSSFYQIFSGEKPVFYPN